MRGERVAVLRRRRAGEDSMGEPVFEWAAEIVDNVLVRPLGGSDLADARRPDGVRAEYRLAFPKTYEGELPGCRVALIDRGMGVDPGAALRVSGFPDRTRPCPTLWNMTADVGRTDG